MTPLALALCVALFPDPAPPKAAARLTLVTDASWKGSSTAGDGWEKPDFDDSRWKATARGNSPADAGEFLTVQNLFARPTTAGWMWGGDQEECFLRRTFEVPAGFRRAELLFAADDVADVYLNGRNIAGYDTNSTYLWAHRGGSVFVDLVPYLSEGKNTLAVRVQNRGGPRGFALELRVDEAPVLPVENLRPLPKEVDKAFNTAAAELDDDAFAVREAAKEKLIALVTKHGAEHGALLAARVQKLIQHERPEVHTRAGAVLEALRQVAPDEVVHPHGAHMNLPGPDLETLGRLFTLDYPGEVVTPRALVPARTLLRADRKAVVDLLRKSLKDADTNARRERVVRFALALELNELSPELAKLVRDDPKTTAAAFAAVALGRAGAKDHRKALEDAAKCDHEPTARAAKHALRLLDE